MVDCRRIQYPGADRNQPRGAGRNTEGRERFDCIPFYRQNYSAGFRWKDF